MSLFRLNGQPRNRRERKVAYWARRGQREAIQAAYQRGREDGEYWTRVYIAHWMKPKSDCPDPELVIAMAQELNAALLLPIPAAARGDGEQG